MKTNCWLILGTMIATGALAQSNVNTLPPIPAPITSAPAEQAAPVAAPVAAPAEAPAAEPVKKAAPLKHKKPAAPKRAPLNEPTVSLVPGPAEVAVANLNVRGQAGLKGEAVAHLNRGEMVTVLGQITLDKHQVGEPAQWAKIALPASTHVWVFSKFIDAANKTVMPKKLNMRAGPGENFSVLGVIEQGDAVKEITTKGSWTEIEPPASAYAFVAAMYLKQEASGNLAANVPPSTETQPAPPVPVPVPAPTPTPVPEPAPIMTEPTTTATAAPGTTGTTSATTGAGVTMTGMGSTTTGVGGNMTGAPDMTAPVDTNPPPPRIVSHEGVVGHVDSLIAPTAYELYDPVTRAEINFLYTTSTNLDISRYNGMRIIVTGEEGISERWPHIPVLTIHRIEVLETNAIPKAYYPTPRQRG